MSDERRPAWGFNELSEDDFRAILRVPHVRQVRSVFEMVSADLADEWLEVAGSDGIFERVPDGWSKVWVFVGYSTVPGLFKLNHLGRMMADRVKEIDAFEKREASDMRIYLRLKSKFEPDTPLAQPGDVVTVRCGR